MEHKSLFYNLGRIRMITSVTKWSILLTMVLHVRSLRVNPHLGMWANVTAMSWRMLFQSFCSETLFFAALHMVRLLPSSPWCLSTRLTGFFSNKTPNKSGMLGWSPNCCKTCTLYLAYFCKKENLTLLSLCTLWLPQKSRSTFQDRAATDRSSP